MSKKLRIFKGRSSKGIKGINLGNNDKVISLSVVDNVNIKPNIYYVPTPKRIRDGYQYYTKAKINNLRKAGYKNKFLSIEQGVEDYLKNYLLK